MKIGEEDERKRFRKKGINVILKDELEESKDNGKKRKVIMKEEKKKMKKKE
jgi:hypothetical protein